jgi:fibronectin-binding autotransporter adhesin
MKTQFLLSLHKYIGRVVLLPLLVVGGLLSAVLSMSAADRAWTGGNSPDFNWNTNNNWGGTAPVAGDALFFDGSTGLLNTNNFAANTPFAGITFNTTAGIFSLAGNAYTLVNGGGITNNSANIQTNRAALAVTNNNNVNYITTSGGGAMAFPSGVAGGSWASGVVTNNTLIVQSSQLLLGGQLSVGGNAASVSNTVAVYNSTINGGGQRINTGAGNGNVIVLDNTIATNFGGMIIGNGAAVLNSTLIITNGSKVYKTGGDIFDLNRTAGSTGNKVVVTGPGSAWINQGTVNFKLGGASGVTDRAMVEVNNGAIWDLGGGTFRLENNLANNCSILANGGVITNVASMILGNGRTNNSLVLTNGGKFYGSLADGSIREIGRGAAAHTNSVIITGTGSLWDSFGATYIIGGNSGAANGNTWTIANGGTFTNGNLTTCNSGGSGDYLIVSNANAYITSLILNAQNGAFFHGGSSDTLYVDYLGNSLTAMLTNTAATTLQLNLGWKNGGNSAGNSPILGGLINIVKTGTGTQNLGNLNTFVGNILVAGGTLGSGAQAAAADGSYSAFGALNYPGKTLIATNGGTINLGAANALLNGLTPDTLPAITVYPGSTLNAGGFNPIGAITLNGGTLTQNSAATAGYQFFTNVTVTGTAASTISVGANNLPNNLLDATAGGTTFNVASTSSGGADLTISAGLADDVTAASGALIKTGAGYLLSTGTNSFTGLTTVANGKLGFGSYSPQSGGIAVNDGATLSVTVSSVNQMVPATLTLGSGTGAAIEFVNLSETTLAPVIATNLTLNGAATVNLSFPAVAAGNTYPLITYTTISGTGGFVLGAKPRGSTMSLATNNNGDGNFSIVLNVTTLGSAMTDVWTGSQNGNWDINTSVNWTISGLPETYFDGDFAQFTDASSVTNVTLTTTLTPGSTTVNSTKNYTFISSSGGHITGTGGLSKSGSGSLTLSGVANTYSGDNTITGGLVVIDADANLGVNTNNVILNGGGLSAADTLTLNANRMLLLGPGAGTVSVATNQTLTFAGIVADNGAAGALVKTGPGTLSLSGTNTYTGLTTVSAGKLIVTTAQQAGGAFTVNDAAALTVQTADGVAFPMSGLTLGNGGSTTLNLLGITGTNAPVIATNLTATGTVTLNVNGATKVGEVPLIQYSTFTGTIGNFAIAPLAPQVVAVLTNNTSTKTIALRITSVSSVTWSAAGGTFWDLGTTTNWLSGATPTVFINEGAALFDNSAASGAVSIRTLVSPASVVVDNTSARSYTFTAASDTAGIGGTGGLTKLGSGTMTFTSVTNSYSGSTVIGGGRVIVSAHAANAAGATMLEFSTNSILITNNAFLDVQGVGGSGTIWPQFFANPITINGGSIFAADGGQYFTGPMTIGPNGATLGQQQANKRLYIDGVVSGSGPIEIPVPGGINDGIHTAGGSGYSGVEFSSPANPYNGTITLYSGHIGIQDTDGTALANATLNLLGFTAGLGNPILWTSNLTHTITFAGLAGTAPLNLTESGWHAFLTLSNAPGATLVYSGALSDSSTLATLTKVGTGTQWLVGTNTYGGDTTVSGGVLGISTVHAGNGNFIIADGAGLAVTNVGNITSAAVASLTLGSSGATSLAFHRVADPATRIINCAGAVTLNSTATVIIASTNGLVAGNTYPLLGYGSLAGSGSFALSLPGGVSATLTNDSSNLWIALHVTSVGLPTVNPNPPQLLATQSGNTLSLAWPTNGGWTLLTNSVSVAAPSQWYPYPDSTSLTNVNITLDPTKTNVFFRMAYPYP